MTQNVDFSKKNYLNMILMSDHFELLMQEIYDNGEMKKILPEIYDLNEVPQLNPWHDKNVYGHTIDVVKNSPKNLIVRLAALFHDVGKKETRERIIEDGNLRDKFIDHQFASEKIARNILKRFEYDENTIEIVCKLILYHQDRISDKKIKIKKFLKKLGDNFEYWKELKYADISAHKKGKCEEILKDFEAGINLCYDVINKNEAYDYKHIKIKSEEIDKIFDNLKYNKNYLYDEILNMIIENNDKNDPLILKNWIYSNKKRFIIEKDKKKNIFYMTVGISGSGKSTFIKKYFSNRQNVKIFCPDEIREKETGNVSNMSKDQEIWKNIKNEFVNDLEKTNNSIFVLDATNTSSKNRKNFLSDLPNCYKVAILFDNFDVEECYRRVEKDLQNNINRSNVPYDCIKKQYNNLCNGYDNLKNQFDLIVKIDYNKSERHESDVIKTFETCEKFLQDKVVLL